MARRKRRRYPYQGFRSHEEYLDAAWRGRLADLRAFKQRFGHTRVPQGFAENRSLERWVRHQRELYRLRDIRQDREQALRRLGFEFVLPDAPVRVPWEQRYRELCAFKRRFGHTRVPAGWSESARLGHWVKTQRQFHRLGLLSLARTQRLQALGFEWRLRRNLPWAEMYERLREFRRTHGHCDVTERSSGPRLAHWVQRQRMREHRGRLAADRRRKLARLGFRWEFEVERRSFEERLAQLRQFRRRYGHVNVPRGWPQDPSLPVWIGNQRRSYREKTLSSARIARLEQLGLSFHVLATRWEAMFQKLARFRQRFGHARVPTRWRKDPRLALWVVKQRSLYREGKLPRARQERLATLGFFEGLDADPWDARYEALCAYHREHGHVRVGIRDDASLCLWIGNQRRLRRQGLLSRHKVQRLDSLGFDWDPHESAWRSNLAGLRAYRERHGDCNVPHSWTRDPALGFWVAQQRQRHREGRLAPERIRTLERLGFDWRPPAGPQRAARALAPPSRLGGARVRPTRRARRR
jgi:hypothetical protein